MFLAERVIEQAGEGAEFGQWERGEEWAGGQ